MPSNSRAATCRAPRHVQNTPYVISSFLFSFQHIYIYAIQEQTANIDPLDANANPRRRIQELRRRSEFETRSHCGNARLQQQGCMESYNLSLSPHTPSILSMFKANAIHTDTSHRNAATFAPRTSTSRRRAGKLRNGRVRIWIIRCWASIAVPEGMYVCVAWNMGRNMCVGFSIFN
ncbi:hypothetical protein ACMFMF_011550 [Clarireedia jacksonii]